MWRLFSSLWRLFTGHSGRQAKNPYATFGTTDESTANETFGDAMVSPPEPPRHQRKPKADQRYPRLTKFRYQPERVSDREHAPQIVTGAPYRYSNPFVVSPGMFLDMSNDLRPERLDRWELPLLKTPQDLADWLQLPLGKVAWLTDRFTEANRPVDASKSHYHYCWKQKKSGGYRLIEAPLPLLRQVQEQILDEILSSVPVHAAAHGFCSGRSVVTNARPHVGQQLVIKMDLDNFYTRVRYARVVALFRSLGYSREVALWLARLTTSAVPSNLPFPGGEPKQLRLFLARHLPQGAPTSPAIANLVAYNLDVRLAGLARSFKVQYTRYADDLTFSGGEDLQYCSRVFLPLVSQIVRDERFQMHATKRKFLLPSCRQQVTGVVVNEKTNISRKEFDRLKATLYNCVKTGPAAQNRNAHADFQAHLRGRIAYVQQLNPARGAKLLDLYQQIRW
ncbi:RNA-directed DNA polymerase [bacterium]|nr:RNA-directed DNA polymerase [bacterium]